MIIINITTNISTQPRTQALSSMQRKDPDWGWSRVLTLLEKLQLVFWI